MRKANQHNTTSAQKPRAFPANVVTFPQRAQQHEMGDFARVEWEYARRLDAIAAMWEAHNASLAQLPAQSASILPFAPRPSATPATAVGSR